MQDIRITVGQIDFFPEMVRGFLSDSGMSRRRFGVEAVGDPDFVRKLVHGRKRRDGTVQPCDFQVSTVRKAMVYIANWREG